MKNFRTFAGHDDSHFSERRLVAFGGKAPMSTASETFDAFEDMRRNTDVRRFYELFNTAQVLAKYQFMKVSPDRENFFTLVSNEAFPSALNYRTMNRTTIQAADLLGLLDRFKNDKKKIGDFLLREMPDWSKNHLDPTMSLTPDALGQKYIDFVTAAQLSWERDPPQPPNQIFIEAAADRFLDCKQSLQTLLDAARIDVVIDPNEKSAIDGKRLSQQEFLALLSLVWNGETASIVRALGAYKDQEGVDALRALVEGAKKGKKFDRLMKVNMDVSVGTMSQSEALNKYDVVLGPGLLHDYIQHSRGLSEAGKETAPNGAAAAWWDHPAEAFAFLDGKMPATPGNQEFLRALRYYRVLGPDDQRQEKEEHPENVPKMSREDLDTVFAILINTLRQREQVVQQSLLQRNDWKQKEKFDESVERHFGQGIEYLKNFREHPIGSALMGVTAFLVARGMWKFLRSRGGNEGNRGVPLPIVAALGAGAWYFYEKHTTGKSTLGGWFNKGAEAISGFYGAGADKEPGKETFPEYWSKQMTVDPELSSNSLSEDHMQYAISELQDKPIGATMRWYKEVDLWRNNGAKGSPPALPFSIYRRSKFFGAMPSKDVTMTFYQTLHRFFYNRGKTLSQDPRIAAGLSGTFAERGYAFINDTYNQSSQVQTMIQEYLPASKIDFDLDGDGVKEKIDFNDPTSPNTLAFIEQQPLLYKKLSVGRIIFSRQMREENMAKMQMWQVFLTESDPKILAGMGEDGARLASLIEELQREVKEADIDMARGPIVPDAIPLPPGSVLTAGNKIRLGNGAIVDFDGIRVPSGAILPEDIQLPNGAVLTPPLTMPRGTVLPPNGILLPRGVTLPDNIVIPPGSTFQPGFVLPKGAVLSPGLDARGALLGAPDIVVGDGVLLDDGVAFGPGVKLEPGSTVPKGATLPSDVRIGPGVKFAPDSGVLIPKGANVDPSAELPSGVKLEKDLQLPPGTTIKNGAKIENGTGASLPLGTVDGAGSFIADHVVGPGGWTVD